MNELDIPQTHPTPSLLISAPIVQRNIARMQRYCDEQQLQLRPHAKTHKSRWMARQQLDAGAAGLTVAKVGEAAVMASETQSLFIAYPTIGAARIVKLTTLAKTADVRVGLDSQEAAALLADAARQAQVHLGVLVDIDVGFHRTGLVDPQAALELCEFIASQSHLKMEGLMCFPGHMKPASEEQHWQTYAAALEQVLDKLRQRGIPAPIISGGSTPTASQSHRNAFLNEIRPGTYIYNDWNEVCLGVCGIEDCAARVLATVVSVPSKNKFVVDAGSKTLSNDRNAANPDSGFGHVIEYPGATITRLSEEHGEVSLGSSAEISKMPKVGDRVWIVPNHICVCVNLQNEFYLVDGDEIRTMTVDARGLLV